MSERLTAARAAMRLVIETYTPSDTRIRDTAINALNDAADELASAAFEAGEQLPRSSDTGTPGVDVHANPSQPLGTVSVGVPREALGVSVPNEGALFVGDLSVEGARVEVTHVAVVPENQADPGARVEAPTSVPPPAPAPHMTPSDHAVRIAAETPPAPTEAQSETKPKKKNANK